MWEISLYSQIISFFCAILIGAMLSAFYDAFKGIRKTFYFSKTAVFFQDITFWLCVTLTTFLLLIARCNGEIRGYIIIGELIGFFAYRCTLSRLLLPIFLMFLKKIRKIKWSYSRLVNKASVQLSKMIVKIWSNKGKIIKKLHFKRKKS
ncbi:MAG: hypothetical protein E7568_00540 [Ruminococcaceae bacterium]|nr:hypothetical protein [Oscillospiraceae bacterium]